MQHHFDVQVATKYGVYIAIFLSNMAFWIQKNIANGKHYYDGKFWTYNSVKAYSVLFPYLTPKQIRKIIEDCIKKKLIIKGNYNENKYDKTSWYALTDLGLEATNLLICPEGQKGLPPEANEDAPRVKPIPDRKQDKKTNRKEGSSASHYPLSVLNNFGLSEKTQELVKKHKIDEQHVKEKFKNYLEDKGRKTFKVGDLENWFINEVQYITKIGKSDNKQVKSKVKDYHEEHEKLKTSDKQTAKAHLKAIMAGFGKKSICGMDV